MRKLSASHIDLIQYRDKTSGRGVILENCLLLKKSLKARKKIFIVNDYVDVAKVIDADGVHLGQADASLKIARKILGQDKIIGISCHSLRQAQEAQKGGADYIGIGPIFASALKPKARPLGPEILFALKKKIKIPFFAIGNINLKNIKDVAGYGQKRIALCRGLLEAEDIKSAASSLNACLN
jgi:thiamine-phosphate pyrophosphorylase